MKLSNAERASAIEFSIAACWRVSRSFGGFGRGSSVNASATPRSRYRQPTRRTSRGYVPMASATSASDHWSWSSSRIRIRLHVRAALTRKNYLFAGSDAGGERAAVAYTILGSCRLAGVNPREYLADVLPRLARGIRLRDVGKSIPVRWQTARARSEPASAPER